MLEEISDWVIRRADGFGLIGLAVVSATEAALQPVPPDLLVLPMALEADSSFRLFAIFLTVTVFSVLGSLIGYAIGLYGGLPLIEKWAKPSTSAKLQELISRYGEAGVFLAAVSPIPYKVLAWTAGAGKMDIRTFLLAGIFGRSIRFGLEVAILGFWGDEFIQMLEDPLFWLVIGIFTILIFIPANSWWKGLDGTKEQHPR
ncbi:MAG: hypothetical protein CMB61_03060 [Euryarchaeota archaeon]|nr:hypothetical protein [Euryarchaeota archaeon]